MYDIPLQLYNLALVPMPYQLDTHGGATLLVIWDLYTVDPIGILHVFS